MNDESVMDVYKTRNIVVLPAYHVPNKQRNYPPKSMEVQ